jgi:murein DD-endopeptidase MepM/ murein hydrolase activator NlpD
MALRFTYNEETCRYEPVVISPNAFVKRALSFLSISFLIGAAFLFYYNSKFDFVDEENQREENIKLKAEWQVLHAELEKTSADLAKLEEADDHTFRTILELEPLSQSIREAGTGGREKESDRITNSLIQSTVVLANKITNRLTIERQSMAELKKQLESKTSEWSSRPAIQPINNKNLIQLHTVFGMRLHPIFGYVRPHNGLDFTAPHGSPVYATGDGIVEYTGFSTYGNVVYLNHGFHFETRYAHLSKYIVTPGQKVKRGQVIGYVGNTGVSAGPHLHYEVLFKGDKINPIGFFQRDLSNSEFEKLIQSKSNSISTLD